MPKQCTKYSKNPQTDYTRNEINQIAKYLHIPKYNSYKKIELCNKIEEELKKQKTSWDKVEKKALGIQSKQNNLPPVKDCAIYVKDHNVSYTRIELNEIASKIGIASKDIRSLRKKELCDLILETLRNHNKNWNDIPLILKGGTLSSKKSTRKQKTQSSPNENTKSNQNSLSVSNASNVFNVSNVSNQKMNSPKKPTPNQNSLSMSNVSNAFVKTMNFNKTNHNLICKGVMQLDKNNKHFLDDLEYKNGNFVYKGNSVNLICESKPFDAGSFGVIYACKFTHEKKTYRLIKKVSCGLNNLEENVICKTPEIYNKLTSCSDILKIKKLEGDIYMPMASGSLGKLEGKLSHNQAIKILAILQKQLLCLFDKGLYYFDIKPDNVLFSCFDNELTISLGDLGSVLPDIYDGTYVSTIAPFEFHNGVIDINKLSNNKKQNKKQIKQLYTYLLYHNYYLLTRKQATVIINHIAKQMSFFPYWDEEENNWKLKSLIGFYLNATNSTTQDIFSTYNPNTKSKTFSNVENQSKKWIINVSEIQQTITELDTTQLDPISQQLYKALYNNNFIDYEGLVPIDKVDFTKMLK